jgi:hypothetical protein
MRLLQLFYKGRPVIIFIFAGDILRTDLGKNRMTVSFFRVGCAGCVKTDSFDPEIYSVFLLTYL